MSDHPEPEPQMFEAAMTITATAEATHPEDAEVPPAYPNPACKEHQR